jgi:hypothetical protein
MAAKYHLDVKDDLASILPADPATDDGSDGFDPLDGPSRGTRQGG